MGKKSAHTIEDLKFVSTADVYKGGALAGRLWRDEKGAVAYKYMDEYDGPDVAETLPRGVGTTAVEGGGVPAFFAGLLPEGHRLTVLRKAAKVSADDELTLLLAIGNDVPGDVQITPEGVVPKAPTALAMGNIGEMDFRKLTDSVDGVGIAGVQDKASAAMVNAPVNVDGCHAILKIDPPEHENLVVNEALHLTHARKLGVPVADAAVVRDRNGLKGLLVERFDRLPDGTRLAMEDAAQLMGILPAKKYQVSSEELVRAVKDVVDAPMLAARNLYLQFLFAWLTGNGDLHAKNVSVLQDVTGRWAVAPMYDLPCTLVYRDMTMALPIAGKSKNLRAAHWKEFAGAIGLPEAAARSVVRRVFVVAQGVDLSSLPFDGSPLYGAERELRFRRAEAEKLLG